MSKVITLLGSTGSIGTQSLDVCRMHGYEVFGLSANSSVDKLLAQIAEFHRSTLPSPTRQPLKSCPPRWQGRQTHRSC